MSAKTYLLPEIDPLTRKATGRMKEFRDVNGNGTPSLTDRLTRQTADMKPHERSAQADAMRRQLVELTAAHNRLARLVESHGDKLASLTTQQGATFNSLVEFCGRSLRGRLRWIFTGR